MAKIVQLHRLNSSLAATYIGPQGEPLYDIGAKTLRMQDGVTAGGFLLMQGGNNLLEVANAGQALTNLGGAPLANPNFTGGAQVAGDIVATLTAVQNVTHKTFDATSSFPVAGIAGLGSGVATLLAAGSSGSGNVAGTVSPSFTTPSLGVASAATLTVAGSVTTNTLVTTGNVNIGGDEIVGHSRAQGAGGGSFTVAGFATSAFFDITGITSQNGTGVEVICISNGVVLTNGASSWSAISERDKKKNIEEISDPYEIIAQIETGLGHYLDDENDRVKRSFVFYENVLGNFPAAAATVEPSEQVHKYTVKKQITVKDIKEVEYVDSTGGLYIYDEEIERIEYQDEEVAETKSHPGHKGVMYDQFIPLILATLKEQYEINKDLIGRIKILETK